MPILRDAPAAPSEIPFYDHGWFGIVAGAIIAALVSYYFYRKSLRRTSIHYTMIDTIVIEPALKTEEDLLITFHGKVVPRVTSTTVAIWNSGTEIIAGSSILSDDPLRIETHEGVEMLRVQTVERTKEAIVGDVPAMTRTWAQMRFRYLDPMDGIVVEILHTGTPSSLIVKGTVMGAGEPQILDRYKADRIILVIMRVVLVPLMLFAVLLLMGIPLGLAWKAYHKPWPTNLFGTVGALASIPAMVLIMLRAEKEDGPNKVSGVPDKLAAKLGRRRLEPEELMPGARKN